MYKPDYHPETGKFRGVVRGDGAIIPWDVHNADWRAFLKWQYDPETKLPIDMADREPPAAPVADPLPDLPTLTSAQHTRLTNRVLADYLQRHPQAAD